MERLSSQFIESLLYDSESTSLDFKSQQYLFVKATDEEKSELLKDVFAFANSYRTREAYIIIGVKPEEGKQHTVVGCEEHIDDAHLQQFVDGKTNRPIVFAYEIYLINTKKVGIIRIPIQERPIYANKDFGKVKKNVVYYRIGSSTKEAGIDEIYKMGRVDAIPDKSPLILLLEFADLENQDKLGKFIKLSADVFEEPEDRLPDYLENYHFPDFSIDDNHDYWRELEKYKRIKALLKPIGFFIENKSDIPAKNIHIEIINDIVKTITVDTHLPNKPSRKKSFNISANFHLMGSKIQMEEFNKNWKFTLDIGDIKPKSRIFTPPFYIGSTESQTLKLNISIYGENLSEPQLESFSIEFIAEKKPSLTIDQLKKYDSQS